MVAPTFYKSLNVDVTELVNISGAKLLNLELAKRKIFRLASLANSDDTSLVFIENKKHIAALEALHAAAIFCPAHLVAYVPTNIAILLCSQPHLSFCKIADNLLGPKKKTDSYISPHAKIADSAVLEEGVTIEAGACIGERAQIGSGTIIKSGAIIADNCTIGRNCFIGYNTNIQYAMIGDEVSIHSGSSLGQDGFGYIIQADGITKVPQMGRIIIQDKVEIGANTTIDRGSLDDTIIGAGTKIDNLVQIGHNVVIGRNCIIAAHTGIAGSVIIGDNTMLGGNVGIKDHIKIGDNVQIMAASGVMNDIKDGEKWGGIPARPVKQWFREVATLRNIVGIDK